MFEFSSAGSFSKTEKFLSFLRSGQMYSFLEGYAQRGADALSAATPVDSGLTSQSWGYEIQRSPGFVRISWINTNLENGFPVAVMLQYGHGTGTGGYVQGRDYINPAIKPIFDEIANSVWKAVTSALWPASTSVSSI